VCAVRSKIQRHKKSECHPTVFGLTSRLVLQCEVIGEPMGRTVGSGNAAWRAARVKSAFQPGHRNRRKCTATARCTGQQCRNIAMRGVPVCLKHGGRGLQVIKGNREAKYAATRRGFRKS
jgi:hypothetical protein